MVFLFSVMRKTAVSILIGSMVLLPTACSSGKTEKKVSQKVPVRTDAARLADIPFEIRSIGNVEAYNTVAVKAQVNGEIVKVSFKEGQYIAKGDLLFKIDPRPYEAALRQAEANLARDRAQAKKAAEDVARYTALIQKGYVARQDYDQVIATGDALNATVKADLAAVEANRLQLDYTEIRSPISGMVGNTAIDIGNIVKANDATLVTVNQINPVNVAFTVPEGHLGEVKKYMAFGAMRVEASIPEDGRGPETGVLVSIDNAVDKATGTIRLKATFENRNRQLWPGQFVNLVLHLYLRKNAIVVPSQAVLSGQSGPFVFVVEKNMTAEVRSVTIAGTYRNSTLIEKGLQQGDRVVTDGQMQLTDGAKVQIQNGVTAASSESKEIQALSNRKAAKK